MTAVPAARDLVRVFPDLGCVDRVEPLAGDGSARRFYRVFVGEETRVLLEGPDPRENGAYVRIARHLAARGVRVPRVFGVWEEGGWILLEDLGDRSLFRALRAPGADPVALYRPVLDLLVRMQVDGARGFRLETGFAPRPYDERTMVEDEGLYFAREFAQGVLGLAVPAGFRADLERLAARVPPEARGYFLHRDFQSRNLHLTREGPAAIDFQGARPGPLAYDAAALLLDPYADLPHGVREALLEEYRNRLGAAGALRGWTEEAWIACGTFRLLQALGAFGKLGWRLGKPGFREHAPAALRILEHHLAPVAPRFPRLAETVARAREALERSGKSPCET